MRLGDKLREIRKAHNMKQKELAQSLGVNPDTLGKWERGEMNPAFKHVHALLGKFDLTLGYEFKWPDGKHVFLEMPNE